MNTFLNPMNFERIPQGNKFYKNMIYVYAGLSLLSGVLPCKQAFYLYLRLS